MSKNTIAIALNCSVKISGTLYAPDDVVVVSQEIADRLIEQKYADKYVVEDEAPAENADGEDTAAVDPDDGGGEDPVDETIEPAKSKHSKKGGKPTTETVAA